MPSILKMIEGLGPWSFSRYLMMLVPIGVIFLGVVIVSEANILSWPEATIIIGAIVVLVVGLVWTCGEVRRLNR